jgi:hypothetical protein
MTDLWLRIYADKTRNKDYELQNVFSDSYDRVIRG